ncbi:hypothetical protein DNHGIG_24490 [Collibacillus ludicampi]|jgi:hypothetical protein|uniref:Uncharacterized protein n=1 Tax=Collibacillus ludicampi TaxID=2771369 RepID=A0AAV4LGF3_9BACL|nr:hypothetical protein DNHGIG_24490 [Collibacillus ludicampi]
MTNPHPLNYEKMQALFTEKLCFLKKDNKRLGKAIFIFLTLLARSASFLNYSPYAGADSVMELPLDRIGLRL